MIVHTTINGRAATVAYLHSDWSLASEDDHDLVKVIFDDDGGVLFLRPADKSHVQDEWEEEEHPRVPAGEGEHGGEFTSGGGGGGGGGGAATKEAKPARAPKPKAVRTARTASASPHSYPKDKIGGTNAGAHPAKISPSVTSTKFKEQDSDSTYVRNDLEQMRRTESDPVEVEHEDGTVTEVGRFTANMNLMKNSRFYPGMRPDMLQGSADDIAHNAVRFMKENMRFLLSKATAAQREAVRWYRGARAIVDVKVRQYGLNDASVAAVYAALSPQKDWDQNIYLGNQVIDIYMNKQNHAWDDDMQAFADRVIEEERVKAAKMLAKSGKVKTITPTVQMLPLIMNKTLAECESAEEKGLWIRAYEEAHGDPEQNGEHGFRAYNPDGTLGEYHRNIPARGQSEGRKAKAGWNNTKMVGAAVASLMANGDRVKIGEALSQVHKVRNFYNNILDPDGTDGDVTMDTHAIGAAWMQPYPGGAPAVAHGLANAPSKLPEGWEPAKDSNRFGAFGTYGMYAEAYRELAAEHDPPLLPNQMQAVIWVIKRDLFANTTKADDAEIEALWQSYNAGSITHEQVLKDVWAVGERANARRQQS